jgi:PAS domain S-box-containing protein
MFHEHEIPYYLFENASIAIAIVRDDKFVFVNKHAEIMTGYSSGELTSKDFVTFIHPDDRTLVYRRYLQRIKGEDAPISYEFRIIAKTGCCRWVEIKSSIISYDTGPATLCFLSDISERKIAEEALKNREAILKSIFDASDVGILVLKNRIMTKINSAFCKMTGYSEEDLQNQSTAMLYLDHNSFCQVGRDLCTISPNVKIETLMKKKNGTLFTVRITSSWLDPKDVEAGMCLTVMDISIDKMMQAKLVKSEKQYRDLSDFLPQIVYENDNEGTLTYVNKRWYSSFGYSPEDVARGMNALVLITRKDSVLIRDSAEKAASRGTGLNIECNAVRKNGLTFPVLAFMAPIVQGNTVAGFRNLMVDITQQKQLENQRNEAMQTTLDIIEFLPDPTFVIDNKSNVVAWNKAIEVLTGVKKVDILGRGEYAYAVPFYGKPRPILIDQIFESNDGFETKYDYVNHENDKVFGEVFIPHFNDGKGVFLWGCACPLYSRQGVKIGAIESIRDITEIKRNEDLLRQSEARYRGIFETSFEGIFQAKASGVFSDVNQSFVSMLGYRSSRELIDSIGMDSPDFIKDATERTDIDKCLASEGKIVGREIQLYKKNHEVVWTRLSIVAVKTPSGNIESFNGVIIDVTKRKQTEQILNIQHDLVIALNACRNFNEGMTDVLKAIIRLEGIDCGGVYSVNPIDKSVMSIAQFGLSEAFAARTAYFPTNSANAILVSRGKPYFGLYKDYPTPKDPTLLSEGLQAFAMIPVLTQGVSIAGIFLASHKQSTIPDVTRNVLENIAGQIGITLMRIRSEIALRDSEERFRQFSDNVTDGFSIVDFQTKKCIFTNPAMDVIHGISLTGKDLEVVLKIIHPEDRSMIANDLMSGEKNELEYRIVRPDSNVRWMRTRKFFLNNETGNTIRLFGVSTDITEQKKALNEAELHRVQMIQADKMATLGILVSGVAHEINNPNNYLMLNSKIIKRVWHDIAPIMEKHASENPKFKLAELEYREAAKLLPDIIEGLSDGTLKIKRIVDSLRDYARKEPPDFKQEVDINKIVESSLVLLSNMVKKVTDHFTTHLMNELPLVIGSAQQLEQVVINLLSNSCQALTERGQRIDVHTFAEGNEVVLKVIDEGIGIAPENIGKIFDPFFTTKRDKGGTGLGLPISKNIINNHNGFVDFLSVYGKGTTVTVRLPSKPEKSVRKIV